MLATGYIILYADAGTEVLVQINMCLANMENESKKYSSKDGFLKSAHNKRVANKRKAEPDMRVEAILGCTCKRIRREIEGETSKICSRKENFIEQLESTDPMCRNKSICLNETYVNLHENFMDLLNDPQQVEDFLRHVENQQFDVDHDFVCRSDNCNWTPDKNEDGDTPRPISAVNPEELAVGDLMESYQVDSFCADFDTLYTELVESLVSVEKWMNLAATASSQNKTKMDLAVSWTSDEDAECTRVLKESFTSIVAETS